MRVADRLLSVLIALALLFLGLVLAAEVIHTLFGQPGHLLVAWEGATAWAREHSFSDLAVLAIGAGVGVVGLALLITEIRRRRPALLVLQPRTDGVICAVSRSSVNRALAARTEDVDGIRGASARLRRRRADVTAVTALRDPGDVEDQVAATVSDWLGQLDLVTTPAVRVRLKRKASS
jgi:hypothetical protein